MATLLDPPTGAPLLDMFGAPIDDGSGFADPPSVLTAIASAQAALFPPAPPAPNAPPLPAGPPLEIINACADCAAGVPHADDNGGAVPVYASDPANPAPVTVWQSYYYVDSTGAVVLKVQLTDGSAQYTDTGLTSPQPMGTYVVDLRLLRAEPRGRAVPALLRR